MPVCFGCVALAFSEFPNSSPDEFPKQHSQEGRFFGLIDLRERG
jgi:hypothetical protein